jgi:hypothetical protein
MKKCVLTVILAFIGSTIQMINAQSTADFTITAKRYMKALITPRSSKAGSNICGPSVIKVPSWVKNPLGKYYMYFARHSSSAMKDSYIRFAYADSPLGPWTADQSKVLRREQLLDIARVKSGESKKPIRKKQHIASPDVIVDHKNKQFVMYFHGSYKGHNTGAAVSKDGLNWEDKDIDLGHPYLRVFENKGTYYGFSQGPRQNKSSRIIKLNGMFEVADTKIIPETNWRHVALLKRANKLLVFYSRYGDTPGRIMASSFDVSDPDIQKWSTPSKLIEVLKPEHEYEGSKLPLKPSGSGRSNLNELRDPCILEDDGKVYLYYSVKGEVGIAAAELFIDEVIE